MKTKFNNVYFEEEQDNVWFIYDKKLKEHIGMIEFYEPHNTWLFTSKKRSFYTILYLDDIIKFMKQLVER